MNVPGDTVRAGLVIERLEGLNSTSNANPRWHVWFTDGTDALTMSDTGCASGLGNPEFRNTPLDVTFTRAGRIRHVTRINPR
jgi:hypothetical protein